MTITQLYYVLAVAEHQNFTKAAEKCFVTQPTLSMQIQKLEDQLDIQIFDRTKKPIELTEIGKKIVNQAKNIVNEADRIQDIVDQQKGFIGGEFKLGIIPTVMPTLLPMFLKTFIKRYPKVKLKIEELTTEEIIQRIKDGNLDAAIASTPLENENIKERVLYFEPFVAYVPNHHRLHDTKKLDINDLEIEDMLLLEDGHCFRDGVINLCKSIKQTGESHFQLESGSIEMLVKLSNEGLGIIEFDGTAWERVNEKWEDDILISLIKDFKLHIIMWVDEYWKDKNVIKIIDNTDGLYEWDFKGDDD